MIPYLGQEVNKMSLEHLVTRKDKGARKNNWDCVKKDLGINLIRISLAKVSIHKITMDFSPSNMFTL